MDISILEKVRFLLEKSKSKECSDTDLETIISYANEFSDHLVLGRVFGYSVGAYALAALFWIDSPFSKKAYDAIFPGLTLSQKKEVQDLIGTNLYLQY